MANILDYQNGPFRDWLSIAEAAAVWAVDQSMIQKAISDGRMVKGQDCQKYGKQWIVTWKAMRKVFSGYEELEECKEEDLPF